MHIVHRLVSQVSTLTAPMADFAGKAANLRLDFGVSWLNVCFHPELPFK
jgi:hypothetical protein